jgi:hypothetical protein
VIKEQSQLCPAVVNCLDVSTQESFIVSMDKLTPRSGTKMPLGNWSWTKRKQRLLRGLHSPRVQKEEIGDHVGTCEGMALSQVRRSYCPIQDF